MFLDVCGCASDDVKRWMTLASMKVFFMSRPPTAMFFQIFREVCSSQDTYTQRRAACSFLLSDLLCKNARLTTNSSRFLTTHNCFRAVNLTTPSMYEGINGRLSLALLNISECSLKNRMEMSGNRHRKSWTPRKTCWQDWNIFESLLVRNNFICIYFMNLMLSCMELTCYVERGEWRHHQQSWCLFTCNSVTPLTVFDKFAFGSVVWYTMIW